MSHLLPDDGSGTLFASLREAVAAWNLQPPGRTGVIVLMDSLDDDRARQPAEPLEIEIGERSRLLIVAGEWPLRADSRRTARQRRGACPATSTRSRSARTVIGD